MCSIKNKMHAINVGLKQAHYVLGTWHLCMYLIDYGDGDDEMIYSNSTFEQH